MPALLLHGGCERFWFQFGDAVQISVMLNLVRGGCVYCLYAVSVFQLPPVAVTARARIVRRALTPLNIGIVFCIFNLLCVLAALQLKSSHAHGARGPSEPGRGCRELNQDALHLKTVRVDSHEPLRTRAGWRLACAAL
jgi:hypothetical protein